MPRNDSEMSARACIVCSIAHAVHCINQHHNSTSPVKIFQREFEILTTKNPTLGFVSGKEREVVRSFRDNLVVALQHYQ